MNCMLTAYSKATGIGIDELVAALGHDGEEIIDATLPEPFCRRSFTTSEFNSVLYPLGFTFTELVADEVDVSEYTNSDKYNYIAYNTRHCENYMFIGPCTLEDLRGIILVDDYERLINNF